MSKDRFSPRESRLGSVPLWNGLELLLDSETCRHLGLALPHKNYRFKISKIPAKKKRAWLKNL